MDRVNLKIIIYAIILLLPLYAVIFYSGGQQRQLFANEVEEKISESITLISFQENQFVENIKQDLIVLSKTEAVAGNDVQKCNTFLADILSVNQIYGNVGVADPGGNIYCSAIYIVPNSVNIVDRAYFQNAIQNKGFSNGDYQIGRVTKKPGISFGYPIYNSAGGLKSVLYISLNIDWFNNYLQQFSLPEKSTAVILDGNGDVISKSLNSQYLIGDNFTMVDVASFNHGTSAGRVIAKDSTGKDMIIFYKRLSADSTNPLYLLVMADSGALSTGIDQVLGTNFILLAIAPLPGLLFALIVGRRLAERNPIKKSDKSV